MDESRARLWSIPGLGQHERRRALEALVRSTDAAVREPAIRMAAAMLTDDDIAGYLKQASDESLRHAGLEMLKRRGAAGVSLAVRLLDDPDPRVVLQAVRALDHHRDPDTLGPLRRALRHSNEDVVIAALMAMGSLRHPTAVQDIEQFLAGKRATQIAAIDSLSGILSPGLIAALTLLGLFPLLARKGLEWIRRSQVAE